MAWPAERKPLVLIRWRDSHASAEWRSDWDRTIAEWEDDPDDQTVLSVGWLYATTARCHDLFGSQNAQGQMQGLMQIPLAVVHSVDTLREPTP